MWPGEVIIPEALQTPELLNVLRRAAKAQGIPLERFRVGSRSNSINPNTGAAEFDPYVVPGGPIGEITLARDALHGTKFPWRDITSRELQNIIHNEMGSFQGNPQQINQAMWGIASVIKNRQASGQKEKFGPEGTLAPPVLSAREKAAVDPPAGQRAYPRGKAMYDMAGQVADLITSAPDAFPSPWPHKYYNTRPNDSTTPNRNFGADPVAEQYGPFKTPAGNQWLNIYGNKRKP